jgi:hypothetical protein
MYGDHQYGYDSNYYYQDENRYGYDSNYYQEDNRYGYDNNHQKKSSHTDIQKIKCVNSNINVNGIDVTEIPQDGTATAVANEQTGPEGANTQNGNGLADRINFNKNLVNICVNVNDNEQVKVSPPETTLTVAKQIECVEESNDFPNDCEDLLSTLDESDFLFQVTGNNPNPSSEFPGSISGTVVTLNPGDYEVTEIITQAQQKFNDFNDSHDDPPCVVNLITSFTGDCDEVTSTLQTTGTITAGEAQTCTATNSITISEAIP